MSPADTDNTDDTGTPSPGELPAEAWTVARLNSEIEATLTETSDRFSRFIVGEIADLDRYDFGTFFQLRDLDEAPVISCLAWSSSIERFDRPMEAGTEAVVEATVDFYPDRGDCQLLVTDYWPLGTSDRQAQREQLATTLAAEGLFDDARKQPVSRFPGCVGVITSPAGSAIEDFCATVTDRSQRTTVCRYGVSVQGEGAVSAVVTGVQTLDSDPAVETIIITRGGGADTTLATFDAEPLVRAVAACSTPTVVAIGHEDDRTLAERAADVRAMTPTEAGVAVTPVIDETFETLAMIERRITTAYETLVDRRTADLDRRIDAGVSRRRQRRHQRASLRRRAGDLERRIDTAYRTAVGDRLGALETRVEHALQRAELLARDERATARVARGRVAELEARIGTAYRARVERELQTTTRRLTDAYRDIEAAEQIAAHRAETTRLRIVVLALIGLVLLVGAALVAAL